MGRGAFRIAGRWPEDPAKSGRKPQAADDPLPTWKSAAPRRARTAVPASIALVALRRSLCSRLSALPVRLLGRPATYVSANAVVSRGLTPAGVLCSPSSPGLFYWHPVTWLSHMTDVQLFGLDAGLHHVTNVTIHVAGTLLFFGCSGCRPDGRPAARSSRPRLPRSAPCRIGVVDRRAQGNPERLRLDAHALGVREIVATPGEPLPPSPLSRSA